MPQGDRIHITTWSRDFKDWIEQVKEHETYSLYNGEPILNDGPFKVCPNPLKLVFNGGTTMTIMAISEIPTHKYNFHPIEKFLKGSYKPDMLYVPFADVIGVLQDVLWDDYCKQFMNYNTPGKMVGPTITVLTHAWCKTNTVSGAPSLSNAWNGSRLLLNLDHPQVDEFKESFGENELSNVPALSLSLTCESSLQTSNKCWTSLNEVKSIRAIYEGRKDCFATTIGTTKRFRASKFGWYFESCPGCKASNKSQGENFECPCGITNVEPATKF
ncbi:uncharacterized protein LOC131616858 [Vicia villosa]|uniref:uncharacterized protein LOC131616858 n=1 Tax=Vicia villosa TaxID=3911 RepID=UPI00273C1AC5|nr:uncharacterized protein LOC131616858 [Vicia villosa]